MKNAVIKLSVLLFIVPFQGFATNSSIDKTPVIATVTGLQDGVKTIALLADGRLQIVPANEKEKVYSITVPAKELSELTEQAQRLSNIEVVTKSKMLVCAAIPKPSLSNLSIYKYNSNTNKFETPEKLILTSTACWMSKVTTPKDTTLLGEAQEFRKDLVDLALSKKPTPITTNFCEETAKAFAFHDGVDFAQGNVPFVGEVTLKKTEKFPHSDDETLVYEIDVENNNEDNETWVNVMKVEVTHSPTANTCILDSVKKLKTK